MFRKRTKKTVTKVGRKKQKTVPDEPPKEAEGTSTPPSRKEATQTAPVSTPRTRSAARREAAAKQAEEEAARLAQHAATEPVQVNAALMETEPAAQGKKGKKGGRAKRTKESTTSNNQQAVQQSSQEPSSKRFAITFCLEQLQRLTS